MAVFRLGLLGTVALFAGCDRNQQEGLAKPADLTRHEKINGISVYYQDVRTPEDLQRARIEALQMISLHGWTKDSTQSLGIGSHYPSSPITLAESRAEMLKKFGASGLHRYDSSLVVMGVMKSWADLPKISSQHSSNQ